MKQIAPMRVSNIQYNPAEGAFTAMVEFCVNDATLRICARVAAPITATTAQITEGVIRDAQQGLRRKGHLKSVALNTQPTRPCEAQARLREWDDVAATPPIYPGSMTAEPARIMLDLSAA